MKKLSMILLLFVIPVLIIINTSRQVEAFIVNKADDYVFFQAWYDGQTGLNNSAYYSPGADEIGAAAQQYIATSGLYDESKFDGYLANSAKSVVTYNVSIDNQDDMLYLNLNHHGDLSLVAGGTGTLDVGAMSTLSLIVWFGSHGSTLSFGLESQVELWSFFGEPVDWAGSSFEVKHYTEWNWPVDKYEVYTYDGGEFDHSYWVGVALDPGDYFFQVQLDAYADVGGVRPSVADPQVWANSDSGNTASFDLRDQLPSGAILVTEMDLTSAVPIPGAVWLLGSGLIGIVGIRRKFKK